MTETDRVYFYIGGIMPQKAVPELLELLTDNHSIMLVPEEDLKNNLTKILQGKCSIDSDDFGITLETIYLLLRVRGEYRLIDIENFCMKYNLPFTAHCQQVIYGDGGSENSSFTRYEWEPGMNDVYPTPVGFDFEEEMSKGDLDPILRAARDCQDFKTLPGLINNPHPETASFAKRCLAGEPLVKILIDEIQGLFSKQIAIPEFKLERVRK